MHRRTFLAAGGCAGALWLSGCRPGSQPDEAPTPVDESAQRELKVLLVDDPAFAELLLRDWKSTSQRPFSVANVTIDELRQMSEIGADVVIYPPALLGELAEADKIAPLDDRTLEKPELGREELIDLARAKLGYWGNRAFGVPYSATHLLMVYREDLVNTPPKTWPEFDELSKKLASQTLAALDPLAQPTRSLTLLARAASRARGPNQHSTLFDVSTMKPLIDSPPFVAALEELVARAKGRADEALSTTTQMVWEQLISGQAAIGITWPNVRDSAEPSKEGDALRFSILPGTREYYVHSDSAWAQAEEVRSYPVLGGAGRLCSAVRGKLGVREGANLLVLLAGKVRAESLGAATKDAFPGRQSQLARAGQWLGGTSSEEPAKQFAETVMESLTSRDFLFAMNLPKEAEYSVALDRAIEQAVREEKPAQAALSGAAEEWSKITSKVGLEQQKLAYLRSLGLEDIG